jgi:hypothetical protein
MKGINIVILIIGTILTFLVIKMFIPNVAGLNKFDKILNEIKAKFGLNIAKRVEQIYRLETANFTSKQFLGTHSAGMMKFSPNFPYGWNTMFGIFWSTNPSFAPIGTKTFIEGKGLDKTGGGEKEFLVFRDLKSAMFTLAEFLKHYGNPGRWYSLDTNKQNLYVNRLNQIQTIYV